MSVASEVAVMMSRLRDFTGILEECAAAAVCKSLLGMKVVVSSIMKNFAYYTTLNPRRW
jgi:hypothetical protein